MGCSRQSTTYARIRIKKQSTRSYDNETDLCICKLEARLKEAPDFSWGNNVRPQRSKWYIRQVLENFLCLITTGQDQRIVVEGYDICITKERSIKPKMGRQVPSTVGKVGEKVFIDLVSLSETVRKNYHYLLTLQDGFASAYLICNKVAGTVARVWIGDLGVKAACITYITTEHTSTGQTPLLPCSDGKLHFLLIWYSPKADKEMGLSDWTKVKQERF